MDPRIADLMRVWRIDEERARAVLRAARELEAALAAYRRADARLHGAA